MKTPATTQNCEYARDRRFTGQTAFQVTPADARPFDLRQVMATVLLVLAAAVMLFQVSAAFAEPYVKDLGQVAIEEAEVRFRLNDEGTGTLTARCPGCQQPITLTITGNSRAFIENEPATFPEAAAVTAESAGVVYDPKTNALVHITVRTEQR